MHAQKFQIRYSPVQDRVLIIVTGEDAQEQVFGLTRRTVKRPVPGLRGIMGDEAFASLTPDMPFDPPTPKPAAGGIAQISGPGASAAGGATGGEASATEDRGEAASAKSEGAHVLQISDTAMTLNVSLNGDQIIQFT